MPTKPPAKKKQSTVVGRREHEKIVAELETQLKEAEGRIEELQANQVSLEALRTKDDIGKGEQKSITNHVRDQRNQITRSFAQAADGFRSTSIKAHHSDRHGGHYDECDHHHCRSAREFWDFLGGVVGYEQTMGNPEVFWDARDEGRPNPKKAVIIEAGGDGSMTLSDASVLTGPVQDEEISALHPGKKLRRLYVPDPAKDKGDDPGMPKLKPNAKL